MTEPSPQDGHQQHPPPAYDTDKKGYRGISEGALGALGDLHDARNFAEMIVDTVREGLLVLDFDLRVVAANESFYERFVVRPEHTVGKLVFDLGNGQWAIPALRELLEGVLPNESALDDYEIDHAFEGIGTRVMLLNARRLDDHQLILLAIEDVTDRRRGELELKGLNESLKALNESLEERVEERSRQIRELSSALAVAEEQERQRIARVLHDDLQQLLYGAKLTASSGRVDQLESILGSAIEITRTLSHEMMPPLLHDADMTAHLNWLAEHHQRQYGLTVEVTGQAWVPDPGLRILVSQILRELLLNVVKHADTHCARLSAGKEDGRVWIAVEDQGAGSNPERNHEVAGLGLASVRERLEWIGGRLDIASSRGQGTRAVITVPSGPTER